METETQAAVATDTLLGRDAKQRLLGAQGEAAFPFPRGTQVWTQRPQPRGHEARSTRKKRGQAEDSGPRAARSRGADGITEVPGQPIWVPGCVCIFAPSVMAWDKPHGGGLGKNGT